MAEDHAGNKLAVKVQHEGLRESADADIATIQALVSIAKFVFPTFDCEYGVCVGEAAVDGAASHVHVGVCVCVCACVCACLFSHVCLSCVPAVAATGCWPNIA